MPGRSIFVPLGSAAWFRLPTLAGYGFDLGVEPRIAQRLVLVERHSDGADGFVVPILLA
jgi:hypothetical protein